MSELLCELARKCDTFLFLLIIILWSNYGCTFCCLEDVFRKIARNKCWILKRKENNHIWKKFIPIKFEKYPRSQLTRVEYLSRILSPLHSFASISDVVIFCHNFAKKKYFVPHKYGYKVKNQFKTIDTQQFNTRGFDFTIASIFVIYISLIIMTNKISIILYLDRAVPCRAVTYHNFTLFSLIYKFARNPFLIFT